MNMKVAHQMNMPARMAKNPAGSAKRAATLCKPPVQQQQHGILQVGGTCMSSQGSIMPDKRKTGSRQLKTKDGMECCMRLVRTHPETANGDSRMHSMHIATQIRWVEKVPGCRETAVTPVPSNLSQAPAHAGRLQA